ncbi:DUF254-domain-containing protein [Gonapodya prolifera JEL478]|uniref:Vacuolar fusion protein MON1 n=1 Tax=Gonapodya prolifera (strain JEL478) TaxID=1344416 RepID=A0A139ABI8_GONPJ|nr:DUF254-domain-containing protein [Gonapodya prolifera JEL478]|eukprot:KXS14120.1 DUF254-domain-containing protein [Gonapodya prolifera JEL478]
MGDEKAKQDSAIFDSTGGGSDSDITPAFLTPAEPEGDNDGDQSSRKIGKGSVGGDETAAESSSVAPTERSSAASEAHSHLTGDGPPNPPSTPPATVDIEGAVADAAAETVLPMRGSKKRGPQRAVSPAAAVPQPGQRMRLHHHEDVTSPRWYAHKKHFFILSSAGKPIYTRYGDESKLSSFMGVVQAVVSFFAEEEDGIRSIHTPTHTFVFLFRWPLYFLCVSSTPESPAQLRDQLRTYHTQILSVITNAQLQRIFSQRASYDIRHLLSGTEIFLDNLPKSFHTTANYLLNAVPTLRMNPQLRAQLASIMASTSTIAPRPKALMYALLVANGKLVTLVRPRDHSLHPADLHLLLNMLSSSPAFRHGKVESWTPVCLPRFNPKAFLHAYFGSVGAEEDSDDDATGPGPSRPQTPPSYTTSWSEGSSMVLVLLGTEREAFWDMRDYRIRVSEDFATSGCLKGLEEAVRNDGIVKIPGNPHLLHFFYKSRTAVQYTEMHPTGPLAYRPSPNSLNPLGTPTLLSNRPPIELASAGDLVSVEPHNRSSDSVPSLLPIKPPHPLPLYPPVLLLYTHLSSVLSQQAGSRLARLSTDTVTVAAMVTQREEVYVCVGPWCEGNEIDKVVRGVVKWGREKVGEIVVGNAPVF